MNERKLLVFYFTFAGLIGGVGATYYLWPVLGPEQSHVWLGYGQNTIRLDFSKTWLWFAYPILGAVCSAFWARLFGEQGFGLLRGALVSFLAFLSFCVLLSFVSRSLVSFFGYSLFGFILVGWVLVLLGAVTGWLYRRNVMAKYSNSLLNSDAPRSGASN